MHINCDKMSIGGDGDGDGDGLKDHATHFASGSPSALYAHDSYDPKGLWLRKLNLGMVMGMDIDGARTQARLCYQSKAKGK